MRTAGALMAIKTLAEIAADRTDLAPDEVAHCEALVRELGLLADLAFSDLVVWLPVWNQGGFVAAAQARPTTAVTRHPNDLVGTFSPRGRRPELDRAWAAPGLGQLAPRTDPLLPTASEAIGVGRSPNGPWIAAITRSAVPAARASGNLERAYLRAADDLFDMTRVGDFPFLSVIDSTGGEPRVGDGFIRLDPSGMVEFASPNASSTFRRMGMSGDLIGSNLGRVAGRLGRRAGAVDATVGLVCGGRTAGEVELVSSSATGTVRSLPLVVAGRSRGAVILIRDVTELRRREAALLSKDATIREIHHRVKNNLQTVAALLRLQGRRLEQPEARAALAEAERRVGAIAVVHEVLAQTGTQQVAFDEVVDQLITLVRQTAGMHPSGATADGRRILRTGAFGSLPAERATALSMALVELLGNAVEHGSGDVTVRVDGQPTEGMRLVVSDHGGGFPPGFTIERSSRLGLRIVQTLVVEELRGSLAMRHQRGHTDVTISLPPVPAA